MLRCSSSLCSSVSDSSISASGMLMGQYLEAYTILAYAVSIFWTTRELLVSLAVCCFFLTIKKQKPFRVYLYYLIAHSD